MVVIAVVTGGAASGKALFKSADKIVTATKVGKVADRVGDLGPSGIVTNNYGPLNEGPLSIDIVQTFRSGTYNEVVTSEPTALYRVISDNGNAIGGFWTRTKPQGPLQSVIDSALDQNWDNSATRVIKMDVPAGTKLFEGYAAPQNGLAGGGNQVYFDSLINPLNSSWIQ